jgi:HSP20 family protein
MTRELMRRESRGLAPLMPQRISELFNELEEMMSRTFGEVGFAEPAREFLAPSLDLSETEDAIELRMDLPGIRPEEIQIELSGNRLSISGERKEEEEEKGRTYHRIERREGKFSRSIDLPCPVDEDQIDARYESGVLKVRIPKSEATKPRKIEVKG